MMPRTLPRYAVSDAVGFYKPVEGSFPSKSRISTSSAYCIYIHTMCQGAVPVERDEKGSPVVYAKVQDAQREIAEDAIERLQKFVVESGDSTMRSPTRISSGGHGFRRREHCRRKRSDFGHNNW